MALLKEVLNFIDNFERGLMLYEKDNKDSSFYKGMSAVFKECDGFLKKNSIEKIFKVNVVKSNTINLKGKTKLIRGRKSFKLGYKKAVVTLKKGQSIDLATGV